MRIGFAAHDVARDFRARYGDLVRIGRNSKGSTVIGFSVSIAAVDAACDFRIGYGHSVGIGCYCGGFNISRISIAAIDVASDFGT